ncbi:hypothetical protein [Bdellovibrio reynosensis]|uniref:Uncharacterized protein n=1 Tax=Bdellovibrio reynosensis TaxID=2835041 RepID=A0ABY4CEC5_9BACT|nr:hypothetical protein [Bdellovibrio reynosensis]UOF02026.1 hypothetical protein MNR06_03540 [Bdellovibrio reynosensis]
MKFLLAIHSIHFKATKITTAPMTVCSTDAVVRLRVTIGAPGIAELNGIEVGQILRFGGIKNKKERLVNALFFT